MDCIILTLLIVVCIGIPFILKQLEGIDYSTKEMDLLPKFKDESYLLLNTKAEEEKEKKEKLNNIGVDVSRYQSGTNTDTRTQKLF